MRKSKKVLSFLMALAMLSSIVSVAASALAPYKDSAVPSSSYNDIDQPTYTLDQCSSMILDYVDVMLKENNLTVDMSVLGTLNLTSIDNALNGIYGLLSGTTFTLFKGLLGDLKDLDKSGISTYRRASTPAASADTNVIYSLTEFLSDNRTIFSKAVDGSLDMGIANSFVDLSKINVANMAKSALYKSAYPIATYPSYYDAEGDPTPETIAQTCDTMLQDIINNMVVGTKTTDPITGKDTYTGLLDGIFYPLAGHLDVVSSTAVAYDFGEDFLKNVYNLVLVPLLNTTVKVMIRELCGVEYGDSVHFPDGDESNLNEYAAILDIHYTVPTHTFAAGSTFISDLNNILYEIIDAVTVNYTGWVAGDNTHALDNFAAAAKYILKLTDSKFFKDYVAKATAEEIDAMNNQALFSYIARSVVNSTVDEMNIPADADTLVEVVWYVLKELCAQNIPSIDYSGTPKTLDGLTYMVADLVVCFINQAADMNPASGTTPGTGLLPYGQGLDATLTAVMKWVKTNYGGLLNLTLSDTDGWASLDTIVFSVINANWLPASVGGSTKELIKNRIFGDILDLDTSSLFALFDHVAGNDFTTKTIKKVILETIARLLNIVFPGALKSTYTTLDALVNNTELKTVVENVFAQLYARRLSILPAAAPLLASAMNIAVPEEYANPSLILPNCITAATTFAIRNDSLGLNTGATDANGNFVQDNLYRIQIDSIESNIPAITPTNLAGTWINGGDSVNCTLSGTFAANQVLVVTMTYDVYTESGTTPLTTSPLTARAFSYISPVVDDGANYTTLNPNTSNTHSLKYKNIYCNQNYTLANLATQDMFVIERATTSLTDNPTAATVTRSSASVNATLVANGITAAAFTNISTTYNGSTTNVPPFVVATAATRPADAAYLSTFVYSASRTPLIGGSAETFTVPHYVVFYNDYGLPGLLENELDAKRDPSNYTDSAIWDEYVTALMNAVAIQYKPKVATTFFTSGQAGAYEGAFTALTDAVTALSTCEVASPVTVLKTALDTFNPPNKDVEYDDPAYNYMGMADYVAYTYMRYRDERGSASDLYDSQQPPVEPVLPANPTPDEITAYNTAHAAWVTEYAKFIANKPNLKPVDIAYALHRLNLYGGRLVRVPAQTDRFTETLSSIQALGLVQGQYTTLSWAAYQKALNFALLVNSQISAKSLSDYRQTKLDTAREELITAQKQLIRVADYTQLLSYIHEAQALIESEYTADSWAAMKVKLIAAIAVPLQMSNTDANQAIIDAAAASLRQGIDGLVKAVANIVLTKIDPNVVIGVGANDTLLAGLGVGIGASGFVGASTGGHITINPGAGGVGTGATVSLLKDSDNSLVETYTVLIYGDLNGDANITGIDAGIAVNVENYLLVFDPLADAAHNLAGDVNNDGNLTSVDAGIMVNVENYAQNIDQATGLVQ